MPAGQPHGVRKYMNKVHAIMQYILSKMSAIPPKVCWFYGLKPCRYPKAA